MGKANRRQVTEAILQLVEAADNQRAVASQIAAYVISEKRASELNSMLRDVERLRYARRGVMEVTTTSAFPLSATMKRDIKRILGADKLVVNEVINKSVLGGVRIETSDVRLDLTARSRLNRLRAGTIG